MVAMTIPLGSRAQALGLNRFGICRNLESVEHLVDVEVELN